MPLDHEQRLAIVLLGAIVLATVLTFTTDWLWPAPQ